MSVPTLRRMEATNMLRPMVGPHGAHLYDADEVEALAQARIAAGTKTRKPLGEIAAEAFTLFEQGYSVQDAVKKLRQSPDLIRRLLQEYLTGFGEPAEADARRERAQRQEQELEKLEARIDAERDRDIAEFERRMRTASAELERECKREAARASRRRGESDARCAAFWRRHFDR